MTQNAEKVAAEVSRSPVAPGRNPSPTPSGGSSVWWRQPYLWLVLLGGVVVFNLLYAFPRYASTDPTHSRLILDQDVRMTHWSLLVAHVVTGNVAMVTALMQMWGWLRRNHPRVHRISGRVYIFGGALPSAALGVFTLIPLRADHAGSVGIVSMGVLWLVTTLIGLRMAMRHRFAEHQRWMLYSFALALGTTWGRLLVGLFTIYPTLPLSISLIVELANWLGWVLNLLVAHLWYESHARRVSRAGSQTVTYPSPV